MRERNQQLKSALGAIASKETVAEIKSIPKEDTVNRQGFAAYSLDDKLLLLTMLNTLKLQPQYYRTENETMRDLRDLIERIASDDPYFVCQAIIYSRCIGEGMRSINHLAAALVAPFIKGQEWAQRFYRLWNKKNQKGGCIFRPDDMSEIKDVWFALNNTGLPASMRKGFAYNLENYDTYGLAKYKKSNIDIANLVHPNPNNSNATLTLPDKEVIKTLDALMQGVNVAADTWEVAQSEAGQEVAKAVREGKLTQEQAEKVLSEAKADNWESLLREGKLGILAALRNIRNMLTNPRKEMIDMWCELISDQNIIKKNLVLPIYFDLAYDVVDREFHYNDYAPQVMKALQDAYIASIPNLASIFTGKTLIMVDVSGSMGCGISDGKKLVGTRASRTHFGFSRGSSVYDDLSTSCCGYKAGLIAATVAKATGADVIQFGDYARRVKYDKNKNVFALAKDLGSPMNECTDLGSAFKLITGEQAKYDRIVIISDDEINSYDLTSSAYKNYLRVCSPYMYVVDLAAYGTVPVAGDKVSYFYGYGSQLYEDMAKKEFNPSAVIDKVKQIVI